MVIDGKRIAGGATRHGGDAGAHFAEVERLDQIVVGAGIQALDADGDLVLRGGDDDRHGVAGGAQFAQQVEAAPVGQVEVEQHQFIGHGRQRQPRIIEPLHPVDAMPARGDVVADGGAQHMVVFDQQYAHGCPLFWPVLAAQPDAKLKAIVVSISGCCQLARVMLPPSTTRLGPPP